MLHDELSPDEFLALTWLAERQGPDFDHLVNEVTNAANEAISANRRKRDTRAKVKAARQARRVSR